MFRGTILTIATVTLTLLPWILPVASAASIEAHADCPPGYYTCATGYCIPNSFVCDGEADCEGGSDESGCTTTPEESTTTTYASTTSTATPTYFSSTPSSTTGGTSSSPTTPAETTTATSTTTIEPSTTTTEPLTTTPGNDCGLPFQMVDGKCIFVEPFVIGTWMEMRYRCVEFGSTMLEIEDPSYFLSLVQFIKKNGVEENSFWVGGRKDAEDTVFYWDTSRTNMTMGTPFWAIYKVDIYSPYGQEPDYIAPAEQCVLLNQERKLYFSDVSCEGTLAGVVCERDPESVDSATGNFPCDDVTGISKTLVCDGVMNCANNADETICLVGRNAESALQKCSENQFECKTGGCIPSSTVCDSNNDCDDGSDERSCLSIASISTESSTTLGNNIEKSEECSLPYQLVGGLCLFVDPFVEMTWSQVRYRCEAFSGVLLEFDDPNLLLPIVQFIIENGIDARNYWIGGRKDEEEDMYYWTESRTNVTMGTPFWAIYEVTSTDYSQEPLSSVPESCVFLNYERALFLSAQPCEENLAGVICMLPPTLSDPTDEGLTAMPKEP